MIKILVLLVVILGQYSAVYANDLPDGKGKDIVAATCSQCHSLKLVSQNRMSRANWDQTITWMQKNHNLWKFGPELRNKILDYLATNLAPVPNKNYSGYKARYVNILPHKIKTGDSKPSK